MNNKENIWNQPKKKNQSLYYLSIVFSVLSCILSVFIALMLKEFIDIGSKSYDELFKLLIYACVFLSVNICVNYIEAYIVNRYVKKAMVNINDYINSNILKLPVRIFSKQKNGYYISLINNDMKVIEQDYLRGRILLISQGSMVLMGLVAMIYLSLKLTIVVLVAAVLPILISGLSVNPMKSKQEKVSGENKKYTSFIKDYLMGFPVIKSYKIENRIKKKASTQYIRLEMTKENYQRYADVVGALSANSTIVMVIIIFLVGAALTINGEITIGGILAFIQLLNNVTAPINLISPAFAKYKAATGIISNAEKLISNADNNTREYISKNDFTKSIELKNVSFSYDENEVLNNVSYKFEKGKSYALVGLSGSGKSTIIQLLAGIYDSYKGQLLIDGTDLRDISEDNLAALVTLIQQDTFIFDDSIKNNIALYQEYDEQQINSVIEQAALSDLVMEKGGVNALCGENGDKLSGGQKQRIAIARAFLKNTPILLMDEATSALDLKTTYMLEKTFADKKEVTRIAVTHKLDKGILNNYDEILMIKEGKILESGSFEQLVDLKGEFYRLYTIYENENRG